MSNHFTDFFLHQTDVFTIQLTYLHYPTDQILQLGDTITFGRKLTPPEFEFVFNASPVEERIDKLQKELKALHACNRRIAEQQQPNRSSLDVTDLHSVLICSICQDWLVHASTIECSHTFCWSCIDTWLLRKKFECPMCRHDVTREPIRSRALDTIVQKSVEHTTAEQKEEYNQRVRAANHGLDKARKLHKSLELQAAAQDNKKFFHINSFWSRQEREIFQEGVQGYSGDARETYCKLIGLTVQWVHRANKTKLNQALQKLRILRPLGTCSEVVIRQRLLMFLRYG